MTKLLKNLVLAALLALPLAAGGVALPVMADDPVDFVCYDTIGPDGKETIVCEPAALVAEECKKTDPDTTTSECKAATEKNVRPVRDWVAPPSLVEGSGGDDTPSVGRPSALRK